jgi:hypothetical protein
VASEVEPDCLPTTDEGEGKDALRFACRVGTFFLAVPLPYPDPPTLHREIERALEADSRVTRVNPRKALPPAEERNSWPRLTLVHPTKPAGHFHSQGVRLIEFDVSVPIKNQRRVHDRDAPSETYTAVWDGFNLLVAWPLATKHLRVASGGHIASEVLESAVAKAGGHLVNQACSPGCTYEFNHTTILVDVSDDPGARVKFGPMCDRYELHATVPSSPKATTIASHARMLHGDIRSALLDFGLLKNHSRGVSGWTSSATASADKLLRTQMRRAQIHNEGWREQLKHAWNTRYWRRESRATISQLWLDINRIESSRRNYRSYRQRLEMKTSEIEGLELLFERDYLTDSAVLDAMELSSLQAEATTASARIDNHEIRFVTLLVGLVGAVSGAGASLVVAALS